MKVTSQNIDKICKEAIEKLGDANYPKMFEGFVFTPYGIVRCEKTHIIGEKKAVHYLKLQIKKLDEKTSHNPKIKR